jgi:acetyltransferase-like isoleucine patch superfamily enzyme
MTGMLRHIRQTAASVDDREGSFSRVLTKLNSRWVVATYPFAGVGSGLSLHYQSEISRSLAPHIWLGNQVEIGKHTWFHTWSIPGIEGHRALKIFIGDNCRIAARCTITAANSVYFEPNVALASDVLVMDHAHAYEDVTIPIKAQGTTAGGRIRIEEGCRIGQGATILCSNKGELVLGRNSVVTPGAVVTRGFPPGSVLSGNPARVVQRSGAIDRAWEELWRGAGVEPSNLDVR